MNRRRTMLFAILATLVAASAPAQVREGSVARRVDVFARSVVAVFTDRAGKSLPSAPSPEDLEVLEDGVPAVILGIDPILAAPQGPPVPTAPSESARPSAASGEPAPRTRLRQVLYVDTATLGVRSVGAVASAVRERLDRILALGPIEIVLADPSPRLFLESTDRPEVVAEALRGLSKVPGRDRIAAHRRETVDRSSGDTAADDFRRSRRGSPLDVGGRYKATRSRSALQEEVAILRDVLRCFQTWASSSLALRSGILYLASDGFDVDPGEFYTAVDSSILQNEVERIVSLAQASVESLTAGRWIAIPIALNGGAGAGFSNAAEFSGHGRVLSGGSASPGSEQLPFIQQHALDPLMNYADATGGELVTEAGQLTAALDHLSGAYAVTYQVDRPPDGRVHRLTIRSRRPDVVVRTAELVAAGTPQGPAAARALSVLAGEIKGGELPVALRLEGRETRPKGRIAGRLVARVDVASLRPLLEKLGAGRMRVTVAVEVPGSEPFVEHQELALSLSGPGGPWTFEAPIVWPKGARRAALVAEELSTGSWGAGIADLTSAAR